MIATKKIVCLILLICLCFNITGCIKDKNTDEVLNVSIEEVIEKLSKTTKIIIKNEELESGANIMSTITDINVIADILAIMSKNKKPEGDTFLSDGTSIVFEMYDKDDKLIDSVLIWIGNTIGGRMLPMSMYGGSSYYFIPPGMISIIEEQADTIFFSIFDYSDDCDTALELIYEDSNYKYYFSCIKSDKMFIEFTATGYKVTIKEALKDKLITIDQLLKELPDLFILEEK